MLKYYYLDISLDLELDTISAPPVITEAYFKQHILDSIKELFGVVASSHPIDLLKFNSDCNRAIIRVPINYYVKLRAGLTLGLPYHGFPSEFIVHKASPLLLALQGDSRSYIH